VLVLVLVAIRRSDLRRPWRMDRAEAEWAGPGVEERRKRNRLSAHIFLLFPSVFSSPSFLDVFSTATFCSNDREI
jgi:hypothetical protein